MYNTNQVNQKAFDEKWAEIYNGVEMILLKADTSDFSNIPLKDFVSLNA